MTATFRARRDAARPRHRTLQATALAGAAAAAALSVAACSPSPANTATPATPAPGAPPATKHHPYALRGTISAENGNTWTVNTAKGAAYTINISPSTAFGTKKAPATAQSFQVGSQVVVRGPRTGTTVEATRIATAPAKPETPNPTTTPTS
jgi:hypothetical protein